jgi:Secretion system C-terminal sorting domain
MMFLKAGYAIAFSLFLFSSVNGFSQTGPGGVGTSATNAFWVRADAGTSTTTNSAPVSTWQDVSGNANHISQSTAAQQPLYVSSLMNGYPAIQFDNNNTAGQNDYMSGADNSNLDNTNGLTIFTVTRPTSLGNAQSIVAKRTNVGVNQAYMFFYYTSNYMTVDVASNDDRFTTSPTAFAINTNYLLDLQFDGTLAAASRCKVYSGETLIKTATETATSLIDYASPLLVGTTHIGDNRAFAGYMSEIIIYRVALGTASRIIVNNYLSAKYNISIASNDVYTMDNAGNGNFDHEVAGIGRESATDLNTDAKGTGIVRILNPSGLGNDEYMMWGHNNGILQAINVTDIPAGVEARFDRVWRVSQSSKAGAAVDVGSIDMRWDLNGLGPVTASHLRLLIDTNNDGVFSDETPIAGAVSLGAGIYQFTGISTLINQRRFTLATINQYQTPLPVELINFTAEKKDQQSVMLQWQTKSELNNDFFVIQHSSDGSTWHDKFKVSGAGNSSSTISYGQLDETPNLNANYYRLKQVDFNGDFEYSDVRYVNFAAQQISVFPNPADGHITITGVSGALEFVHVRNVLGQLVESVTASQGSGDDQVNLDISLLPAGVYFVETVFGSVRFIKN